MDDMKRMENILDTWAMVERFSEGDFKSSKGGEYLGESEDRNYYTFIKQLNNKSKKNNNSGGYVIYAGIFDFIGFINEVRELRGLKPLEEEIIAGKKFTLALYFDNDLKYKKYFFTISGYILSYIRLKRKVPNIKGFAKFEERLKEQFASMFYCDDVDEETDEETKRNKFNTAMSNLLLFPTVSPKNCFVKLVDDIENDETHLHSFFIGDLIKAKNEKTKNLTDYLLGYDKEKRVDLDSNPTSIKFNHKELEKILSPCHYPLGRFPSNTQHSLSLMQQVAVNLSVGYDDRRIRNVNGPPGTGKTTLLKDIFAELIVKQAIEIVNTYKNNPEIPRTIKTAYHGESSIGELPDSIADNNIIVVSSNNGAVQNIVNELPLVAGIDKSLVEELKEADYFRELSNKNLPPSKGAGGNCKKETSSSEDSEEEEVFWGLFSLEGGKAQNMRNVIENIEHICDYFNDVGFKKDPEAYNVFLEQYQMVFEMRRKAQNYAQLLEKREQYRKKEETIESECDRLKAEASAKIEKCIRAAKAYEEKANNAKKALESIAKRKAELQSIIQQIGTHLETIKALKPGRFARKKKKIEYQRLLNETEQSKLSVAKKLNLCSENERKEKDDSKRLEKDYANCHSQVQNVQKKLKARLASETDGLNELQKEISELEKRTADVEAKPLDTSLKYEELQLANPWFGEDYRKAQSRLFIAALRVRKQFLYENRKSVSEAINVWKDQNNDWHSDGQLMRAVWNWFNFAIPVISSTFASFSSMCKYLPNESLGHIFIDEAGQATPQSAVGVMLLGKHVMAVGDPSQIKPIFTLDTNILSMLAKRYEIDRQFLSDSASVQTLMDQASKFGFYYDKDKSEDSWIGIPLWVHRRCKSPMFDISNKISYHNMMVQGKDGQGKAKWFDVSGEATDKYVKEQGEFLYNEITKLKERNAKVVDHNEKDIVYVISPFVNVVTELTKRLKGTEFLRPNDKSKPTNIGTIHTFQGKEAPIVFLVLGADKSSSGAASWAVSEPNLINVAATRAKEEFYIIGDKNLYKSLGSSTIKSTIDIIDQYEAQHPSE